MSGSADPVLLAFVLAGRDELAIARDADAVSDPTSPRFGQYVDRQVVLDRLTPPDEAEGAITAWVTAHGMKVVRNIEGKMLMVLAPPDALVATFGQRAARWLVDNDVCSPGTWPLPPAVRGYVVTIIGRDAASTSKMRGLAALSDEDLRGEAVATDVAEDPAAHDPDLGEHPEGPHTLADHASAEGIDTGWTAADVRAMYGFPDPTPGQADGAGECVGLLAVGVRMVPEILEHYWRATGVERTGRLFIRNVGWEGTPPVAGDVENLEAYMTAEWIGAMAPGADLVIYNLNPESVPDIHAMVLVAALADVEARPSVIVTSWTMPERRYNHRYGIARFETLTEAASITGMTVVCATGDWGVYDGRPQARGNYRTSVCYAAWPQATFPACCDRVLAIGGSMVNQRQPHTESIWSGPLPPYDEIRKGIPLSTLATSGGFSDHIAIPAYQERAVSVEKPFSRGTHHPAVVPFGRGIPDVSMAAAGPSVMRDGMSDLSSTGYRAHTPDGWVDFGGGTSTGAPVWGAIVALINQRLVAEGLPRLGQPHHVLYKLGADRTSRAFRPVTVGSSDVRLKVVSWDNRDHEYVLAGFEGHQGRPGSRAPYTAADLWNPATGLGVPRVAALIEEVVAEVRAAVAARDA